MAKDFNTEPYFDNYDATKDFYRILFRPSYAVQARELTQLQTILQNQVSRFGDHVFKNGSQVIPGSVNVDNQFHFIKLEQNTGTTDVTTYIQDFRDKIITGSVSGVKLRVVDTSQCECVVDNLDIPTLYCKIEGTAENGVTNRLIPGENVVALEADNQMETNFKLVEDQLGDITAVVRDLGNSGETGTAYTGNSSSDVLGLAYGVDVKEGIYYIDGFFVRNPELHLYVGRFNNTPTARVGFQVIEDTITPEEDESILDNATGSYNFAAPGAHRYKISLKLVKLPLLATDKIRFVELLRVVDGRVQHKIEKASYAELEKTLARRTYDESGNYEVNKFKLSIREHLDDGKNFGVYKPLEGIAQEGVTYGTEDKAVVVVDPGKAYIQGYEVESVAAQYLSFDKARKIGTDEGNHIARVSQQPIATAVGNYATVTNIHKYPSIDTFEQVYLVNKLQPAKASASAAASSGVITTITVLDGGSGYTSTPTVTLVGGSGSNAAATAVVTNGVVTAINVTNGGTGYNTLPSVRITDGAAFGASPSTSNIVGTARIKALELADGDYSAYSNTKYKLGLIDINMYEGKSFEQDVKSFVGKSSVGNFSCNIAPSFVSIIGTASVTQGSSTVTGSGTEFDTYLSVNDIVYVNGVLVGTVQSRTRQSITLTSAYTGSTITDGRVTVFRAEIFDPEHSSLLYNVGYQFVKTLKGKTIVGGVSQDTASVTTLSVRRRFDPVSTSSGNVSFSITPESEFFQPDDLENYLLINTTTNQVVKIDETMVSFDNDNNRKEVRFEGVSADGASTTFVLIATILQTSAAGQAKKKRLYNRQEPIVSKKSVTAPIIELEYADALAITNVWMTPNDYDAFDEGNAIDITERYTLDNGQRSMYYTNAKLVLKPGFQVPNGAIRVDYQYFAVQDDGNYFSVDSYSTIDYDLIPSYYITDGKTGKKIEIPLTDVLDFRPIIAGTNTFFPEIPKIGTDVNTSIAYHLGRRDKLVLDSVGRFNIVKGVPSLNPQEPDDPKEGLVLATVDIPPYTKHAEDIKVFQRDNRRYTMKDIGKIDRRVTNLEYYVTLSLLEKDTATMSIKDAVTGLDKFKNGFIVDQFTGHGIGDVKNPDYRIAVDSQNKQLRPMHFTTALEIVEDLASGEARVDAGYVKSSDIITLPYDQTEFIFNNSATRSIDVNPYKIGAFKGEINLYPLGDNWKDTDRRPDLNVTDNNNYDAIKFIAEAAGVTGTQWNEWQTNWTGTQTSTNTWQTGNPNARRQTVTGYETTVTTDTGTQWRDGIQTSLQSSVNSQDYGDRVVDIGFTPYMRARPITFIAKNLKPSTRFWAFFDGTAIEEHIIPADVFKVTRSAGSSLMNFSQEAMQNNILVDDSRRAFNGKIEPAFSVGDILTNSLHTAVNVDEIANLTESGNTFTVTVETALNIEVGHHVVFYNMDHHNARDVKDLYELPSNAVIPASVGITSTTQTSKELNLRQFKVVGKSGTLLTLGNIDGSPVAAFSAYDPEFSGYSVGRGKLLRLQASGIVAYDGYVHTTDTKGPLTQDIYLVNIKHGFAVGETLYGNVRIAGSTTTLYNAVTLTSINGVSSGVATMKQIGDSLFSDVDGAAVGVFHIPNSNALSFRTGERTFKLIDNMSNSDADFDSKGSTVYYSQGITLSKERTIVNTRTAEFVQDRLYESIPVRRTTTSTRVLYSYYTGHDPVAQTFVVSSTGGVFVSSVDVFFAVAGNRPVTVELRSTNNGVPSTKVIPLSQVTKTPQQLNVSENGSAATTFTFKAPIYLQDGETYALVVKTDEPGCQLFISELGKTDIITGNVITSQPLTGSLYLSQNSKEFEINPLLDMKFVLRKAVFDTSSSVDVLLKGNPPLNYNLPNNPFEITPNTNKIRVYAPNHGFYENEIVIISGVAEGHYGTDVSTTGIPHTLLNTRHTVSGDGIEKDSFIIDLVTTDSTANANNLLVGTNADFIKGEYGGSTVMCSRSLNMDGLFLKTSDLSFQDTKIEYYVQTEDLVSKELTGYIPVVANANHLFDTRMHICSYDNQTVLNVNTGERQSSLAVKAVISSNNPNVSPVIDLQKLSAYSITNLIGDDTEATINVAEIDARSLLKADDVNTGDVTLAGNGTITSSTASSTITGNTASFLTQVVAGNKLYTTADVLIGTVQSIGDDNTITLTQNALTQVTDAQYNIVSANSLTFSNQDGYGYISTNIDTADNLLANAVVGKYITIANAHSNVDGKYVVKEVITDVDTTTFAGNEEGDKIILKVYPPFTGSATIDMITDEDFSITMYDKYVEDFAPVGAHNQANYVTRTMTLAQEADTLKIMFDASIVNRTDIKVYYRTWNGDAESREVSYTDTGFLNSSYDTVGSFAERVIDIEGITPFRNVSIKIVMKSKNPTSVPVVKNFRMLALSK